MRDILDKLTTVVESKGIANRKPGAVFADGEGNEITFQNIRFFPEGGGRFGSPEELQTAVNQVISQLGTPPVETNWFRKTGTGGFGIAEFRDADGKPLYFIRYFKEINPDPTQNYWDNQAGLGTYRYKGAAAVKTQSNATPQDILTNLDDLSPADILQQVETKFPGSNLVLVTRHLVNGGELPFSFARPAEMDIAAFQDYFCELLQPIALQTGQYEGEAAAAAATFLPGGGFSDTTISFGASKTEGLSDSVMTSPDGLSIKVSSKGGAGATASVVNILNAYEELLQTKEGKKLSKKLQSTIDTLVTIKQTSMSEGPLVLAIENELISMEDAEYIRQLKKQAPIPLASFVKSKKVPADIRKLAAQRNTKNPDSVNMYYHVMASVAFEVADYINNHTSFSKDAAIILNNSALVQVYSKVSAQGQQWTLNKFTSKWPGSLISQITLDPTKAYYSTGIKQKYTFSVNADKSKQDDPQSAQVDIADPDTEFKRSDIKASRTKEPAGSEKVLGRKRRQVTT